MPASDSPQIELRTQDRLRPNGVAQRHAIISKQMVDGIQRDLAEPIRVIGGGEYHADVDGALVGGASLCVETFASTATYS